MTPEELQQFKNDFENLKRDFDSFKRHDHFFNGERILSDSLIDRSFPEMIISSIFEDTTSPRFSNTAGGLGSNASDVTGLHLNTGANAGGYASSNIDLSPAFTLFTGRPVFSCKLWMGTIVNNTVLSSFFGLGLVSVAGTGHTYTDDHMGFKITKSAGAGTTCILYATQTNSAGVETSFKLTNIAQDDDVDLIMAINNDNIDPSITTLSNRSVTYYYRINGGLLSSGLTVANTLTASPVNGSCQFSISNNSTAQTVEISVQGFSYKR